MSPGRALKWSRWKKLKFGCGLVAFVFNLGLAASYLPPVRRAWQLHQHRTMRAYSQEWLEPNELLNDRWSWLLRDSRVLEHRARQVSESCYTRLYSRSEDWALLLAARRLNGESNRQILDGPLGISMVLGSLEAEANPPRWWFGATWLQQKTAARPQGTFQMGLLDAPLVESLFERFESLDYEHKACLILALCRHDLNLAESQRVSILQQWKAAQPTDNANHGLSLEVAFKAREELGEFLRDWPREKPVALNGTYPSRTSPQQQRWLRLAFSDFLGSLGYRAEFVPTPGGPRVEFQFVAHDWDQVALDSYHTSTRTERIKHTARVGKYGSSTRYETRTHTDTTRSRDLQAARIPGLWLRLQRGSKSGAWILPPFGEYADSSLERNLGFLEGKPISDSDWFYWDYFVKVHATQNWRFGIEETRFP